jgi:hypothetical protein
MNLVGFRTFLVAIMGSFVVPLATKHGLTLTPDQQTWLVSGGMALLMVAMRLVTKTPAGQATPSSPAASPQAGFARLGLLIPLALLALAFIVAGSGCATVAKVDAAITSPAAQPYIEAAVDAAVATAEVKGVTALQINNAAKAALAADKGVAVSLATISGSVNTQLAKLKLPQKDQAAVAILEVAIDAAIDAKIGANPTIAKSQAAVADVLQALITATS